MGPLTTVPGLLKFGSELLREEDAGKFSKVGGAAVGFDGLMKRFGVQACRIAQRRYGQAGKKKTSGFLINPFNNNFRIG